MIAPKQVQEILDAVRIEEVVGEFVALRRRGVNFIGHCPFHTEKTPSFNVNPTRNIFKCFGCGKGGSAVTFLMEHENFTYPESLRWLARKYNIEIEEVERTPEQLAEQQMADSLYIVNDFALEHFQGQLFDTDEGQSVALAYFRKRGLREDTIRKFGLGYTPDQRDLLLKTAMQKGYSVDLLKKNGLVSQDGTRDFFRARVMFAIHNLSGKVAAFAGRTMSTEKSVPKYVNSPETEIYVKNKTLYGLFQAKKAIRQFDECILVEGYMDVISLHQAGIENVVASSGTSLTEGQLQLIKRHTDNLKILYDGDAAGIKAALRGLDLALEQNMNVRIVLFPNGEDPDSYVQKVGSEAFQQYITQEAQDFIIFKTRLLLDETKSDPLKRSGLVKDILNSIAKIPDPIKRSIYLKESAALMGMSEEMLITETNKLIGSGMKKREEQAARSPQAASDSDPYMPAAEPDFHFSDEQPPMPSAPEDAAALALDFRPRRNLSRSAEFQERDIIRLLLMFGQQQLEQENTSLAAYVLTDIEDSLGDFDNPLYGKIAVEYRDLLQQGNPVDGQYFVHHTEKQISDLAVDLMTSPWQMSQNWIEMRNFPLQHQRDPELNFTEDMRQALDWFKLHKLDKMRRVVNPARLKAANEEGDMDAVIRYTRIQMKINEVYNSLAKRRNMVVPPR